MAKTTVINIRMEPEIKKATKDLFVKYGLTVSEAVNIFLDLAIKHSGKPFEVDLSIWSKESKLKNKL